jgi:hypothetical protein
MFIKDVSKNFDQFVIFFVGLNDTVIVLDVGIIVEDDFGYFLSLKFVKELLGVCIHEIVKILYHRNEFRVFFHVDLFELL